MAAVKSLPIPYYHQTVCYGNYVIGQFGSLAKFCCIERSLSFIGLDELNLGSRGGRCMQVARCCRIVFTFAFGIAIGAVAASWLANGRPAAVWAANDRHEDYIMTTGTVLVNRRVPTDGIWMLDYRTGRLLGTVIDQASGTITGWAELDLVQEFGIPPRQNVHFLMTTGMVNGYQSALYLAETVSGKFGVYTMGLRSDGKSGIAIRRQDLTTFRPQTAAGQPVPGPAVPLGAVVPPAPGS